MNNYLIIWQKWMDPFGEDDHFDHNETEFHNSESIYENTIDEDTESTEKHKRIFGVRSIATPMGIIPITENTASGKIFNFWLGHTNFNITQRIASIIEKIEGVETLDIFTRYRFRIAIGKAFNDSDVMRNINQKLYEKIDHD